MDNRTPDFRFLFIIALLIFLPGLHQAQPLDFLGEWPVIDGRPDSGIILHERLFSFTEKSDSSIPDCKITYRLGYGTSFLYLYIDVWADSLVRRDRAYQNGDGFQLVLAIPEHDSSPASEFLVMGFSPTDNPASRQRKFIWYRNIDLAFTFMKETQLEFWQEKNHTGYELLIPWREVYPFHPWFLPSIGFDLCFVKAFGKNEKSYYFTTYDEKIQQEQSLRRYHALAVFSGHPDLANKWLGPGHPDFLDEANLKLFKGKEIFIYHGTLDMNCPFELTAELVKKLEKAGARVLFVNDDKGHDAPGEAVTAKFFEWLSSVNP